MKAAFTGSADDNGLHRAVDTGIGDGNRFKTYSGSRKDGILGTRTEAARIILVLIKNEWNMINIK